MTPKNATPRYRTDLPGLALTAIGQLLLVRIALAFYAANDMAAVFWPVAGVSLAAVLLGGRKFAVAIFIGIAAGTLWAGATPVAATLDALGSVVEALFASWLLSKSDGFDRDLRSARDYFRLCCPAAALSAFAAATIGVAGLLLSGRIEAGAAWSEFARHGMGDLLGIVVVTPLILVWRKPPWLPRHSRLEGAALVAASFLLGQIVFVDWFVTGLGQVIHGYWMYLIVSWAAVRLGMHAVLAVLLLSTVQALFGVAGGLDVFGNDLGRALPVNFWTYMITLSAVGISLAIVFAERKQAEAELRKLSLAVAQSPVSIIITDLGGRIEYVNPAFTRVSGYSPADILGQTPRLLQSGQTPAQSYRHLWSTLLAGQIWDGEFVNRRKDGTDYIEAATISPLRQADGRITHYVAVKTDITERQRMIAKLRASEESLRLAKNAAGLGIYDYNVTNGTVECDERTRELWGIAPDTALGWCSFLDHVHAADRPATQAAMERATDPRGNGEYAAEYRVIRPDTGENRHLKTNGQVLFAAGYAVRLVGTVKDISGRKQLEREVQERRSALEVLVSQQVAAQTAAAIAHELNQPLVSVSAYSEAALRMLRGGSKNPEKLAHAIEGAMEQAQRAGRTLHELLDFLYEGDAPAEPLDLNSVVRDALAIAEEGGYSGFRAAVELEADLPAVLANRLQLQKVLVNLIHNGVEAMRHAGMADATINIRVRSLREKGMAQLTVQDSGPGLQATTAHRVFDPFFTTKPQGIGLGLAISRALIEAHGGQLWNDPDASPGASFHFILPFAP
ncbi:MAG: PAS domain S-box protein [Bacteroidota bacterium]